MITAAVLGLVILTTGVTCWRLARSGSSRQHSRTRVVVELGSAALLLALTRPSATSAGLQALWLLYVVACAGYAVLAVHRLPRPGRGRAPGRPEASPASQ